MNGKVLVLSGIKWDATMQRHQMITKWFSDYGYHVTFVEGIISSSFTLSKVANKLKNREVGNTLYRKNQRYKNVKIITSPFLNPNAMFDFYNKRQLSKILPELDSDYDLVINYLPVRTCKFILDHIHYKHLIYDCVRDFSNWGGYPKDLIDIENELEDVSDLIFVDSFYLKDKMVKKGYTNKLIQILPHLTQEEFDIYINNCPKSEISKIFYFGDVGSHIDLNLLEFLSNNGFEVHIAGSISVPIKFKHVYHGYFSDKKDLAKCICENADAIIIPYTGNMNGVIPAKIMQSLATRLPVYINQFYDSEYMSNLLNVYESYDDLLTQLHNYDYNKFISCQNSRIVFIEKNIDIYQKEELFSELSKKNIIVL